MVLRALRASREFSLGPALLMLSPAGAGDQLSPAARTHGGFKENSRLGNGREMQTEDEAVWLGACELFAKTSDLEAKINR